MQEKTVKEISIGRHIKMQYNVTSTQKYKENAEEIIGTFILSSFTKDILNPYPIQGQSRREKDTFSVHRYFCKRYQRIYIAIRRDRNILKYNLYRMVSQNLSKNKETNIYKKNDNRRMKEIQDIQTITNSARFTITGK